MKNIRQEKLLQIISEEAIETQEQLLQRLNDLGIRSTQATISRESSSCIWSRSLLAMAAIATQCRCRKRS